MADQAAEQDDGQLGSQRVANELRTRIKAGEWDPGDQLPTYRQLAADFGVAVNTAMAGVRILRDEGLVTSRPHARPVVSQPGEVSADAATLRSELDELRTRARRTSGEMAEIVRRLDHVASLIESSGE